jgi:pimeloyl-ACP methyl ester carboxylesterase
VLLALLLAAVAIIPQARTLLLEHSGHMMMEEPAALADAVVALIEEDPVT